MQSLTLQRREWGSEKWGTDWSSAPGLLGPGSLALHPPGGGTQDGTPAPRSFQLCMLPLPQAQGAIYPIGYLINMKPLHSYATLSHPGL